MAEETLSPPSKKQWKIFYIVFVLAILFVLSFLWYRHSRHYVWTNDAFIDGYQIAISPDIEARIIELYVDEGDFVTKGQLLCQLDESILNTKKLDEQTRVSFLEEQVRLQKIEREKLRDIYNVARQEYENEIISYIDFDKIEKDYRLADAQYKVAEANLANGIAKLGIIEELLCCHTKIFAARDGAISKRWVVAGDVVQIGQPLFSLTDPNVWITANLEETKIEHLKPGNPVEIHIDAYPDCSFSGSVFVVRASAASRFSLMPPDNATGNFTKVVQRVPIKILLDHPPSSQPLYLYPGMSAEVSIKIR
jgi:membrane fusion protein (multidrug efflux system)